MSTILRVVDVDEGSKPFSLHVELNTGEKGEVDFSPLINNDKYFKQFNTVDKFHEFALEYGTLVWVGGVDIAPEWIKEQLIH